MVEWREGYFVWLVCFFGGGRREEGDGDEGDGYEGGDGDGDGVGGRWRWEVVVKEGGRYSSEAVREL